MRKIITTTFITLDGVMQAPGGPEEDTSSGFKYGGWQGNIRWDEMMSSVMDTCMGLPFELLLGKRTYDIFAAYWPHDKQEPTVAKPFNSNKKYVVSHTAFEPSWHNSICITCGVVAQIKKLKKEDGPDLWVYGSGNLIQTLLKHHLIDRMHLWIYPITLGSGKRLFAQGAQAEKFKLTDSKISTSGVIIATYESVGKLKTDS
jgi:dihydrofolate reductase